MFDVLDVFFSDLYTMIIYPIYMALSSSAAFTNIVAAAGNIIVFILNLFRDVPVAEILDSDGNAILDLSIFYDIDSLYGVIAEIIGVLVLIWILKIFYHFIKFIIDLVLSLVKDLQREIKMHYYLKDKKGGHKQLWLKN